MLIKQAQRVWGSRCMRTFHGANTKPATAGKELYGGAEDRHLVSLDPV